MVLVGEKDLARLLDRLLVELQLRARLQGILVYPDPPASESPAPKFPQVC